MERSARIGGRAAAGARRGRGEALSGQPPPRGEGRETMSQKQIDAPPDGSGDGHDPTGGPGPGAVTPPTDGVVPGDRPVRKRRIRRVVAGILVVLTSLSVVTATVSYWAHRTVFDTDHYL